MTFSTPRQTVVHAGPLVQIRAYGCETACRRVPLERTCDWHGVLFMRSGRWVRTIRGREILQDRNTVGFFNCGEPYQVWHPDERGDRVTEFEVHPEVLAGMSAELGASAAPDERPYPTTHMPIDASTYYTHWLLWRCAELGGAGSELAIDEMALGLVGDLLRRSRQSVSNGTRRRSPATRAAHASLVHETQLVLSTCYREQLDLAAVARRVHASAYHLCRVFKAATGTTIHAYRLQMRLRAALTRLLDPQTSLGGLALDVGFSSQSHLTDAFRGAFGCTPAAVRRRATASQVREMSRILEDRIPA